MNRIASLFAALLLLGACSDAPDIMEEGTPDIPEGSIEAAPAQSVEPPRSVTIVDPVEGVVVDGPDLTVTLNAEGVDIVPAGQQDPNSGHHHLFLNADLTPADQPIPAEDGRIAHMGDGATNYTFENVPAGTHRLIAVVADWQHVPLQPWVVDTVMVTVR